jgi:hypothetical protein
MIVAKKYEESGLKDYLVTKGLDENCGFSNATGEKCACGERITLLAARLQNPNGTFNRKCLACLVHDGKVRAVHQR